jgi:hypothetical protein
VMTTPGRGEREPHRLRPGCWAACLGVVLPMSDRRPPVAAATVHLPQSAGRTSRRGKAKTMNTTKTNKMKALAVNAAMTLVLGAGATALPMPSASAAVARDGADHTVGHVRHSGTDDTLGHAKHRADDGVGHV